MSNNSLADAIRQLRGRLAAQCRSEESDEQLLHAFITRRDEDAFAVLVRRHGPMVLNVCRRVLEQQQDAEDSFQATFLLLARGAASLRNKAALASFLYGTAYRIALTAKRSASRRRKHEERTLARPPFDPVDELSWREVRTLLDEEIARLPEKLRTVFVLCCLEDLSQAEAARRSGLKERTLSSQLAAARKQLSIRLARRGVELTAVLAASALTTQSASALPPWLMTSTIKASLATVAGEDLTTVVSSSVAELVESVTAAMMTNKAKAAVMLLLVLTVLGGAGAWAYRSLARNVFSPAAPFTKPSAARADEKPKAALPKHESVKTVEIQGRVLGPDGKPKARAKLLLLSSKGQLSSLGVSAEDGRFTAAVSKETTNQYGHWLVAQTNGTGIDFLGLSEFNNKKPVALYLVNDNAIRGRVVNTEGQPVRGVRVTAEEIVAYRNNSLDTFRDAWIKLWAGGAGDGSEKQIYEGPSALFASTTDADGHFTRANLDRCIRSVLVYGCDPSNGV